MFLSEFGVNFKTLQLIFSILFRLRRSYGKGIRVSLSVIILKIKQIAKTYATLEFCFHFRFYEIRKSLNSC